MSDVSLSCVVCTIVHDNRHSSNLLVNEPGVDHIQDILNVATERVNLGDLELQPLVEYLSGLSPSELVKVRYHSICRKSIVNKTTLDRARKRVQPDSPSAEDDTVCQPSKRSRGRPRKDSAPRPKRQTGTYFLECWNSLPIDLSF